MASHPGRRKGTGPGGLGSALCHLPVIAQKEGSEGVGTGQSCVAAQGTRQSLSMALSAQGMPLNAGAMALGSNSDFAR